MEKQEIFDKVATHLLTQNKRAHDGSSCVYRAPDGCKCAAGILVSDEDYSPSMEGIPWPESEKDIEAFKKIAGGRRMVGLVAEKIGNPKLVLRLQDIHDGGGPEGLLAWRGKLKDLASKENLDASVLDNIVSADQITET